MSGRGLPSAYTTALDTEFWRPIIFVKIELEASTIRVHDYVGDITWGSQTWTGLGTFGGIETIEEGASISPYALVLRMTNVDLTLAPEAISGSIDRAPVTVYFGMLDDGAALLDDPIELWAGTSDAVDIVASRQGGAISLTCESNLAIMQRINGALFSAEELKVSYSDETFFDFLPSVQDLIIEWKETRGSAIGGRSAGMPSRSRFL